ncbi:MAG TPA: MFS transporter [Ktedonobacteraceae bacterium]|jgi:MFS family permease|nr:MFS transporter [Ktedonobacteraceae bacterium]
MTTFTPSPPQKKNMQSGSGQALSAFVVLLIINILNYADRAILPAVLPKLQADLGINDFQAGLLGSSFLFIYAIATLPLGILADRGTRKNIVAACVGIWSVATALAGMAQNFMQLFFLRSILGIGEAGYAPASLSMIGDLFPREHRGRILSIWSIGNLIGTALGMIVGGQVADRFGWRWAFYLVGIPGLIVAFLIWRAHEPKRGTFDSSDKSDDGATLGHGSINKNLWNSIKRFAKVPTYWVLTAAFVFSFFTIGSAQFWIPTYFVDSFRLNLKQATTISGVVLLIGSLVGTLLGGYAADYLQRRIKQGRLLVATFAFLAGAPLTFIALSMHTIVPFISVFSIAIVCLSLCLGPLNAVIQDIIAPDLRSTAIGVTLLFAHLLGDAASPLIIGALADKYTLGVAFLVTAPTCLLISGLICLLGLRTVAGDMEAMQAQLRIMDKE